MTTRRRNMLLLIIIIISFSLTGLLVLPRVAAGERQHAPQIRGYEATPSASGALPLRVLTLNIAHGRSTSFHQALISNAQLRANLDAISTLLQREAPNVVALQEADSDSIWNGRIDLVDYLAQGSGYSGSVVGQHFAGLSLNYGTALLANLPLSQPESITFNPAGSMMPKGLVIATVAWPGQPERTVDVVSLHLDFSMRRIRVRQLQEVVALLEARQRPFIIMGDFNVDFSQDSQLWAVLQEPLGAQAYSLNESNFVTYPTLGRRLDWVLLSPELAFHRQTILPDDLSDHRAVVAEIIWRD